MTLNAAIRTKIKTREDGVDLYWRLAKVEDTLTWIIGINNPNTLKDIQSWVSKFSSTDYPFNKDINPLAKKITTSLEKPFWEKVTIKGKIIQNGSYIYIQGNQGSFRIKRDNSTTFIENINKNLIIQGYLDNMDQLEIENYRVLPVNTLEMAVMSQCPYGKKAEKAILDFLNNSEDPNKPNIIIRYILYKMNQGKENEYTSLHGPEELKEDLVQIVIRDFYPNYFLKYLEERYNSESSWEILAQQVGISDKNIKHIKHKIAYDSISLMQTEYNYITNEYHIYDGSPTFIWEGQILNNIQQVSYFKELAIQEESCSGK